MGILIVIGAILAWFGIFWFISEVTEDKPKLIGVSFGLVMAGVICLLIGLTNISHDDGYKKGQIDYHNGIIKYELKMNPDSTVVWEEIKTK